MTQVKIKKLQMSYFKGIRSKEINFDGDSIVKGPNGSGKSTIMDAFTWLLWGKNSAGESDTKFLIKTVDETGTEIPHVNHEVAATLDIDGQETTMKRIMVPEYDKDDKLKGNHTEYYFNDVPLKKAEYDQKVKEIIDEEVFKLITSPYAFLNLGWKEQREMLVNMAGGDIKDEDVATTEEFKDLLAKLTGKNLEEYRRELDSKIKRVNEAMQVIPARIDEQNRSIGVEFDIDDINNREADIKQKRQDILAKMAGEEEKINAGNQERIDLAKSIADLKFKLQQATNEEEAKIRNTIHKENVLFDKTKEELDELKRKAAAALAEGKAKVEDIERKVQSTKDRMATIESEVVNLRAEWKKVNEQQFSADVELICPIYKTACHDCDACAKYDQNQEQAYKTFIENKNARLMEIQEKGNTYKLELGSMNQDRIDLELTIEQTKAQFEALSHSNDQRMAELETFMQNHPRKPLIATINISDYPALQEMNDRIKEQEATLAEMAELKPQNDYSEALKELDSKLDSIISEKAEYQQIQNARARIAELEAQLKDLGKQKAELEMEKKTATDFEIAKMSEIGKRVNNLFKIVTWQLFETQVNGEQVPTCKALVNGVRWSDANTAARINAGIDVASSLARSYNASAPMFIDNAECSGNIYNPGTSQRILLEFDKASTDITICNA